MKLDLKPTTLTFTGHSKSKDVTYHIELEFYGEIDVDNSQIKPTPRDISMKLRKKELQKDYWPRLLKTSEKQHWLKTDFDKVSTLLSSLFFRSLYLAALNALVALLALFPCCLLLISSSS
jgi:hypothetical protein